MGQPQSNLRTYQRLERVMPSMMDQLSSNALTGSLFDKSSKSFTSQKDRDQFIYGTITVLSQNGKVDLEQHDFRLLYSRRENDQLVARIVAEREGVIKAQVEPHEDGKDQAEAFRALRRHVEMALDRILREVPGAASLPTTSSPLAIAGPSSRSAPSGSPVRPAVSDEAQKPDWNGRTTEAPPAYGKAVKDWRSKEDVKNG